MNESEDRPNPDDLLYAVSQEETRGKRGRLKIFLGMAAGVGKTYAMLEAAQQLKKDGVDVVVGIVDTHGRTETEEALKGLKIIPEKIIEYKGNQFKELDIDEILKLRPTYVLVDELAHSNIPGSRHLKRWQDVEELLENGIDVYTTLNVQHIESLKEIIEGITDITVRETVPDSVVESANYIELIDLTPQQLMQRLKDGKVYFGDQSTTAMRNFFQEDRLTALREIVLRFAAEKVDHDLHGMVSTVERSNGWRPRERFLVAISQSPHSQKLIRTTRRVAFTRDAPWIAVHVDNGRVLDEEDQAMLAKNLTLARDLGAEVITTSDPDVPKALERIARQHGVTQIIIGRPPRRWFHDFFFGYRLLDQLVLDCADIDIHVIHQTKPDKVFRPKIQLMAFTQNWLAYLSATLLVGLITLINYFTHPLLGYGVVAFNYLVGILLLGLVFRKGPMVFASFLSAVIWYILFIPHHSFSIAFTQDLLLLFLFLITAIISAVYSDRAKLHEILLTKREESTQALYDIVRDIASSPTSKKLFKSITHKLGRLLKGKCEIITKNEEGILNFDQAKELLNNEKEQAAATWVFNNGKEAGWSTNTLPMSPNFYLPLKTFQDVVGVLCYRPDGDRELSLEDKNFLYTVGQQLAHHFLKTQSEDQEHKVEVMKHKEKVYQSVLDVLSTQVESPLKVIRESIQDLKDDRVFIISPLGMRSVYRMDDYSIGLNRVIENIASLAKLNAGLTPLNKAKYSIKELIDTCAETLHETLKNHKLVINISNKLPKVFFDFNLLEICLTQLIFNAIDNSPDNAHIEIEAKQENGNVILSVCDEGCGIPQDLHDSVFEPFFKLPGSTSAGLGLGLPIARTIAENHGGSLIIENCPNGGTKFSISLPVNTNHLRNW